MTERQRLFLVQARSSFLVFELLRTDPRLPACHALHYLQMATELLAKAYAWRHGKPPKKSHIALVPFLTSLSTNRKAQNMLGFAGKNENWLQVIRKSKELADRVQRLAPALAGDGPNPEYPWPREEPTETPVEYAFDLWHDLQAPAGRQFLTLARKLFAAAHEFL